MGCFGLDQVSMNTLYWLAAVKDKTIGQNSSDIPVIHAFLSGTTNECSRVRYIRGYYIGCNTRAAAVAPPPH